MKLSSSVLLSFLDLLTCCLGAMLLLFFVTVLVRQQGQGGSRLTGAGSRDQPTEAFLLVTAERIDSEKGSEALHGWALNRLGKDIDIGANVGIYHSVASQYALFYATTDLGKGVELHFQSHDDVGDWQFKVYEGGDRNPRSVEFRGQAGVPVYVWR